MAGTAFDCNHHNVSIPRNALNDYAVNASSSLQPENKRQANIQPDRSTRLKIGRLKSEMLLSRVALPSQCYQRIGAFTNAYWHLVLFTH